MRKSLANTTFSPRKRSRARAGKDATPQAAVVSLDPVSPSTGSNKKPRVKGSGKNERRMGNISEDAILAMYAKQQRLQNLRRARLPEVDWATCAWTDLVDPDHEADEHDYAVGINLDQEVMQLGDVQFRHVVSNSIYALMDIYQSAGQSRFAQYSLASSEMGDKGWEAVLNNCRQFLAMMAYVAAGDPEGSPTRERMEELWSQHQRLLEGPEIDSKDDVDMAVVRDCGAHDPLTLVYVLKVREDLVRNGVDPHKIPNFPSKNAINAIKVALGFQGPTLLYEEDERCSACIKKYEDVMGQWKSRDRLDKVSADTDNVRLRALDLPCIQKGVYPIGQKKGIKVLNGEGNCAACYSSSKSTCSRAEQTKVTTKSTMKMKVVLDILDDGRIALNETDQSLAKEGMRGALSKLAKAAKVRKTIPGITDVPRVTVGSQQASKPEMPLMTDTADDIIEGL